MQNLDYRRLVSQSNWYSEQHPALKTLDPRWQTWLLDRGSLTERLTAFSGGAFKVKVLAEYWGKPLCHEAKILGVAQHLAARVREVELYVDNTVAVYARTVMPLEVYLQERYTLQNIGTRPLGHFLFQSGKIRIRRRSISCYSMASGRSLFGRSTPYQYRGKEILVSEFFISEHLFKK